jgi:predicted O-methyltransferase YrrM
VTAGAYSLPEVRQLLRVLAVGRRCAEIGTSDGGGAEVIAETAASLVTVEIDPERAAAAAERLSGLDHVELLVGDWRGQLRGRGPFELVFFDGGGWKHGPDGEQAQAALDLLGPGGLLVADDFTPGFEGHDPAREFLFGHPELVTAEVQVAPTMSVIVAARPF